MRQARKTIEANVENFLNAVRSAYGNNDGARTAATLKELIKICYQQGISPEKIMDMLETAGFRRDDKRLDNVVRHEYENIKKQEI